MYPNLEAEMARNNVRNEDIAKAIKKDERTIRNKRSGVTDFTWNETLIIRNVFFPSLQLEYLFEQSQQTSSANVD